MLYLGVSDFNAVPEVLLVHRSPNLVHVQHLAVQVDSWLVLRIRTRERVRRFSNRQGRVLWRLCQLQVLVANLHDPHFDRAERGGCGEVDAHARQVCQPAARRRPTATVARLRRVCHRVVVVRVDLEPAVGRGTDPSVGRQQQRGGRGRPREQRVPHVGI